MARHTGEDFTDAEGIAVSAMFPLQSSGVEDTEFDVPVAN